MSRVRAWDETTWPAFAALVERHHGVWGGAGPGRGGHPEDSEGRKVSASFLHNGALAMFEAHGFEHNRPIQASAAYTRVYLSAMARYALFAASPSSSPRWRSWRRDGRADQRRGRPLRGSRRRARALGRQGLPPTTTTGSSVLLLREGGDQARHRAGRSRETAVDARQSLRAYDTVDELFAMIERAKADAYVVRGPVRPRDTGVPIHIYVDWGANTSDDEQTFTVSRFRLD